MTPSLTDESCPICGGSGSYLANHARDGEHWRCLSCVACNCQYWHPRVIRSEFYADAHEDTYERRHGGERFLRPRHRLFLARAAPGRLLDIGCGEGTFLAEARTLGFTVAGIDLDRKSIEVAAARGLDQVHAVPLFDPITEEVEHILRDQRYDWITAFEVLEHQAHPLAFLRAARELLGPRGTLCGSVPNRERILVARQRRSSAGDFPPHHFLWFSARTLRHTLESAGYREVRVMPVPEDDLLAYAAHLEDALLGPVTRPLKRTLRAPTARSGASSKPRPRRWLRAARVAKNVPFVPLAYALRAVAPGRARSLYFEAR